MNEHVRILVVDDDRTVRETLREILRCESYYVDTAENASQAIEKTNNGFYNLALIDICLPDMNGTELLTRMKDTTPKFTLELRKTCSQPTRPTNLARLVRFCGRQA